MQQASQQIDTDRVSVLDSTFYLANIYVTIYAVKRKTHSKTARQNLPQFALETRRVNAESATCFWQSGSFDSLIV